MTGVLYYLYFFGILPVFYALLFLSPLIVFGICIHLIKQQIDNILLSRFGRIPYLIFAAIGTPVHESSHLLTALLFRHTVKKFSLFSPSDDGRLGYVEHAYDPRSVWQRIGCFFIGISPIIAGSIVLLLLTKVFMPSFSYPDLASIPATIDIPNDGGLFRFFGFLFDDIVALLRNFYYEVANMKALHVAIYLLLSLAVGSHMFPSSDDFKGMIPGLLIFYAAICAIHAAVFGMEIKLSLILELYLPVAASAASLMLAITVIMLCSLVILWILSIPKKILFRD